MNNQPQPQDQTKRSFQWGISSKDVRLLQGRGAEAARDGCNCSDCSAVSPLPRPRREPIDRNEGHE